MTLALFYIFAAVLVFAGLRVITAKNPVHAVLWLILAFFTSACLWILIKAEFLAVSLVVIYVGAVMVLFLFVVMMLDINFEELRKGFWKFFPVAAVVATIMVVEMILILTSRNAQIPGAMLVETGPTVADLGRQIYTVYFLPFQLSAVLLLVGMIAAIGLTIRKRKNTKYQQPGEQIAVKAADRVRVLKMEADARLEAPADKPAGEQQA
ncbi:NADH-quinone oxidoreductase subunit J [Chitinilyticum litopenaei]|uniref:NADH-quinone oxidoreductase subunit J n=1 Tax=Chitinilyticum litopenaei TaxID=1121276 RepID=UPI00041CBBE7|nr:NADH-quinone oxidoreductase subunit J [Chitinilyticum litopenaei]